MAAHAATAIHYLIRKDLGNLKATRAVAGMAGIFEIAAVNRIVIEDAVRFTTFPDFEDAVTAAAARLAGCDCIVSRDSKGFRGSPVRCFAPEALIPLLRRA
jgi:predicted nucleic acid-binding protein